MKHSERKSVPKTDVRQKLNRQYMKMNEKGTNTKRTYREQMNSWLLSYSDLIIYMKTYKRSKQHKHSTPIHKTNKTTSEVSPWNGQ